MSKEPTLRQRIHNAAGSQAVENIHAQHAYLHARAASAEEWDNLWSHSDQAAWGHVFGRMRGFESVYRGSVTSYDAIVYNYYNSIWEKYPQIGGGDPRPLTEVSMHILDTDVIEVAKDGLSARAAFYTPGVIFSNYTPQEHKRFRFVTERYGSDFVFENGDWKYLHEQVCPDYNCSLDCENWAQTVYQTAKTNQRPDAELASGGGSKRPPLEEPGPLHFEYSPAQPAVDSVPWPEPYETLDDDHTYAKHWPPKDTAQGD